MNKEKSEWIKASIIFIVLFSIMTFYIVATFQMPSEKKLFDINQSKIMKEFIAPNGESLSLIIVIKHNTILTGKIKIMQNNKLIYDKTFNIKNLPKGEFIYTLEKYKYANYELVPMNVLQENKPYIIEVQLDKKLTDNYSLWLSWLFSYI